MNRSLALATRRVAQTLRDFDNGWQVLPRVVLGRGGEISYRLPGGGVIHCPNHPGARVPVYEVFAEDTYRFGDLLEGLPAEATVLDIGAHIGCFAVAVARLLPHAQVHSYEASPSTAAWLRRNVAANGLGDRVHVHAEALAAQRGTLQFADNAHGSSLNGRTAPSGTSDVAVPAVTFADAVAAAGGRVDLVKIDTEGAEYDFVLGSDPAAWAGVGTVVMEYHDVPGHGWLELADHFSRAGLAAVRHVPVTPRQGTVWLSKRR
ncbi:MAG: FkbM family methyltransferase [Marmoricola sp.]